MLPLLIDKIERKVAYERAMKMLTSVGMADLAKHLPSELSGGERQRVAIARALVHHPELILADEPTGNLDANNAKIVFELFRQLVREEGAAVVMVTHDQSLALQCDSLMEIANGVIVAPAASAPAHAPATPAFHAASISATSSDLVASAPTAPATSATTVGLDTLKGAQ